MKNIFCKINKFKYSGNTFPSYLSHGCQIHDEGKREVIRRLEKMPKVKHVCGMEPLPRYTMPDESEPEYGLILDELQNDCHSLVGSSYYYIKSCEGECTLCRIIHGGGKVFFHEVIDHKQHGISDEDIEHSVKMDPGTFALPDHYHISVEVEKKLRALMEFS